MEQPRIEQTLDQPLSAEDQALFDRVWQRVMSERGSPELPPSAPSPAPEGAGSPQTAPAQPLPCPEPSCPEYAPVLQEMARASFAAWQIYQTLARRTQGSAARQLRTLAADQQQTLRQLSAAYFLLTGEHLSHPHHTPSLTGPVDMVLRELFLREQRWKLAFAQGAAQTGDECLSELFDQTARRCRIHMDTIRRILEGM